MSLKFPVTRSNLKKKGIICSFEVMKEPRVHMKEPRVHMKEPKEHMKEPRVHMKEPREHLCSRERI